MKLMPLAYQLPDTSRAAEVLRGQWRNTYIFCQIKMFSTPLQNNVALTTINSVPFILAKSTLRSSVTVTNMRALSGQKK